MIEEQLGRFMNGAPAWADRSGAFKIHFASAREAFNMVLAALDGHSGEPGLFRDYRLHPITAEAIAASVFKGPTAKKKPAGVLNVN